LQSGVLSFGLGLPQDVRVDVFSARKESLASQRRRNLIVGISAAFASGSLLSKIL
jgi:hypothetical protein